MTNHEEAIERRVRDALEHLTPDETAKNRMYLEVMRRAAAQERMPAKKKPWYLRWQTSASVCTAALACVVVATAALHSRMPQNGADQLQMVTPHTTTATAAVSESDGTTFAATQPKNESETTANTVTQADASQTQTVPAQTGTQHQTVSAENEAETAPAAMTEASKPSESRRTEAAVVTEPQKTTSPPSQTTVPVETTAPSQGGETGEATVTKAPAQTEDNITTGTDVPIRQNIYLYYKLMWNNVHYDTQYVEIPGKTLEYLGYGVTRGADVDDTYTVLIYAIDGVDPAQQLAVQYAGEDAYYIFTAQE